MTTTCTRTLAFAAATLWASSALAFTPEITCSGWSAQGMWGGASAHEATLELQKLSADGAWVTVEFSSDRAYLPDGGSYELGALWDAVLDGTYRAVGTSTSYDHAYSEPTPEELASWPTSSTYSFDPYVSGPIVCEAPEPPSYVDPRTPGYWKNHPDAWAADSLTLGDSTYDQACLLGVLDLPTRGDLRIKLLHHAIAAQLNLLAGTDPAPIESTLADADDYLSSVTIDCASLSLSGKKPKGDEKALVDALKTTLDLYNNGAL